VCCFCWTCVTIELLRAAGYIACLFRSETECFNPALLLLSPRASFADTGPATSPPRGRIFFFFVVSEPGGSPVRGALLSLTLPGGVYPRFHSAVQKLSFFFTYLLDFTVFAAVHQLQQVWRHLQALTWVSIAQTVDAFVINIKFQLYGPKIALILGYSLHRYCVT
jgi:hypothetical protein